MGTAYKRTPCTYTKETIRDIFCSKDKDMDGKLSISELIEAFKYFGSRCSGFRAMLALLHADKNGDGYVTLSEIDRLVDYTFNCKYTVG